MSGVRRRCVCVSVLLHFIGTLDRTASIVVAIVPTDCNVMPMQWQMMEGPFHWQDANWDVKVSKHVHVRSQFAAHGKGVRYNMVNAERRSGTRFAYVTSVCDITVLNSIASRIFHMRTNRSRALVLRSIRFYAYYATSTNKNCIFLLSPSRSAEVIAVNKIWQEESGRKLMSFVHLMRPIVAKCLLWFYRRHKNRPSNKHT